MNDPRLAIYAEKPEAGGDNTYADFSSALKLSRVALLQEMLPLLTMLLFVHP